MCEANETLNKARYELDLMWGQGHFDYARLKQLLGHQCERHQEDHG